MRLELCHVGQGLDGEEMGEREKGVEVVVEAGLGCGGGRSLQP